jgi:hypothetical protein
MGTFIVIIYEFFLEFLINFSSFWISRFDLLLNGKMSRHTKLVRMVARYLKIFVPLPYIFNIENTTQLMNDLPSIPFDQDLKFFSFYIATI